MDVHIDIKDQTVIANLEWYCKWANKSRAYVATVAIKEYLEREAKNVLQSLTKDQLIGVIQHLLTESEGE